MRMKEGFVLRTVAGQTVVLPSGDELNLNLMITLNETGAFLWEQLQQDTSEENLVQALLEQYEVDEETARASVRRFVGELKDHELLA